MGQSYDNENPSSGWYAKELGDATLAYEPTRQIEELARSQYAAEGQDPGFAVFSRQDSQGRLHCQVTVYFSPAADDLARHFGARPCQRPPQDGLEVLVGGARSLKALFSDE